MIRARYLPPGVGLQFNAYLYNVLLQFKMILADKIPRHESSFGFFPTIINPLINPPNIAGIPVMTAIQKVGITSFLDPNRTSSVQRKTNDRP